MSIRLWKFFIAVVLIVASSAAQAVDPFLDWKTLESPHFYVHFDAPNKQYAQRAIDIAEAAHAQLTKELNWTPAEKTHLVLSDETDFANGFATVIHINRSVLFLAPPSGVGGLEDFEDWLELLITHEYAHILHLDRAEGDPAKFRKLFGRFLLTFPNNFQPAWLIEGLATWKETDSRKGVGRGQSTLFASIMRMEVANGVKPVEQVNLPITTWPAGVVRYLYGVYFYEFISDTRGEAAVQRLLGDYSSNLIPFSINTSFRSVFGKDVSEMWDEFTTWLHQRFDSEIADIKQQGIVAGQALTHTGYRTGPVRVMDNSLYYIENDGAHQARLIRQHAGQRQVLTEVVRAGFDVSNDGDVIISQTEVCEEYSLYNDLYLYHANTDELERLTHCGRYVRAVWQPDGEALYALQHHAGRFSLKLLERDATPVRTLIHFGENVIPGWFDVSPDNSRLVFSLWKPGRGWDLYLYDLASQQWRDITHDKTIQAYPEFTPDGKAILYSAETEYAYNLFRYRFDDSRHIKLTNTLAGAYQPVSDGKTIYYTGYHAAGTDIYSLPLAEALHTEVSPEKDAGWSVRRHLPVATTLSDYNPWPVLRPRWWFPVLVLTEDRSQIGFTTSGNDALGIHNYFASPSWDVKHALGALGLGYSYSNLFSFSYARNNILYKNGGGQLNRIRTEDSLQLVWIWPHTKVLSSSSLLMALSWQNNSDKLLFNGATPVADMKDNMLGLAWLYNSSRIYPLSISRNDGREIRLVAENGDVLNSDFDGSVYTASWREYIRLGGEHVLALRALQGWGEGATTDFRLGGEDTGIEYDLFLQQSGNGLFGRRRYALRGYAEGLPQLRGKRARILSAEWRFPGQRIERGVMAPPVGIMQWSGALFAETGAAYDGDKPDTYYSSAGLELTADLNLFYLVPLRARLGIARGFDEAIGETRAYLSLGSSF